MIWHLTTYPLHCLGEKDYDPTVFKNKHQHDLVPSLSTCYHPDKTSNKRTEFQVSMRTLVTVETIVARGLKEGRGIPLALD